MSATVETVTGDEVRLECLRLLTSRCDLLKERGLRRRLTSLEQRELSDSLAAAEALEAMAPVGELVPSRASRPEY